VRSATVAAVATECERSQQIVMPSYGGKRGHPVGFPASLGAALLAAPPESTLKLALAATGVAHVEIAVDDPGVLRDVDVPSDL
jgi:molybdenum cofactor cytidylyltransferase